MLSDFAEKKETFFDYKKQNFSRSYKSPFSKIRLEIMFSDFAEKKETFLTLEKQNFSRESTHAFGQKVPIFLYLNLINLRLEIMLSDFTEKKETLLILKTEKMHFCKRLTQCF